MTTDVAAGREALREKGQGEEAIAAAFLITPQIVKQRLKLASVAEAAEEIVTEALRDLARWLYRQLQAEYDHLTSNEAIEEGIIVNEYTFTEGGRRFG